MDRLLLPANTINVKVLWAETTNAGLASLRGKRTLDASTWSALDPVAFKGTDRM